MGQIAFDIMGNMRVPSSLNCNLLQISKTCYGTMPGEGRAYDVDKTAWRTLELTTG